MAFLKRSLNDGVEELIMEYSWRISRCLLAVFLFDFTLSSRITEIGWNHNVDC